MFSYEAPPMVVAAITGVAIAGISLCALNFWSRRAEAQAKKENERQENLHHELALKAVRARELLGACLRHDEEQKEISSTVKQVRSNAELRRRLRPKKKNNTNETRNLEDDSSTDAILMGAAMMMSDSVEPCTAGRGFVGDTPQQSTYGGGYDNGSGESVYSGGSCGSSSGDD